MDEVGEPKKILSDEERVTLVDALKAICNKQWVACYFWTGRAYGNRFSALNSADPGQMVLRYQLKGSFSDG